MSSSFSFEQDTERTVVYLYDGDNLNDAVALAYQIQAFSNAKLEKVSVVLSQHLETSARPNVYGIKLHAKVLMRDTESLNVYGLIIPDPIESMFESKDGDLVVKQSVGEELTAFYATFSGRNLEFVSGALCGKS